MENKWLSKLKHKHPLFILSRFSRIQHIVNARRMCRGLTTARSMTWALDEEQRSNEMRDCWTSKKCQRAKERRRAYRNMREKKVLVYAFISALFHAQKQMCTLSQTQWTIELSLPLKTKSATGNVTPLVVHDCTFEDHKYEEWTDTKRKKWSQITTAKCDFTIPIHFQVQ